NGRYTFSVVDVHNQRLGPYRSWPDDAIASGQSLPHLGAQVSFTGSLIENLNVLEAAGVNGGQWNNWDFWYDQSQSRLTTLGNRRLDLVAFGYHHPLMPLIDERDIRMQIRLHKHIYAQTWTGGGTYSKGIFPPETAFSTRIIPALVKEGIEWALIDNIHFDRACENYPWNSGGSVIPPNKADQINPDPASNGGAWVQLQNLWAPTQVSAPFGYQPHWVQHVDPDSGALTSMIAVPAARYEGNEDGRGGYGAFLYDQVMDAYLQYNTDPARPMFVVLHHDGDNFGGGSEGYYNHNWDNMVSWVSGDADYDVTTVQDYLDRFPVPSSAVIHVESGSWAGADAGDPEFKKWLGDPDGSGWSPDRNSWAVMTAAKNRVHHADMLLYPPVAGEQPFPNMQNVLNGTGNGVERAWHFLLAGQASDHWYWDGSPEPWDSNVTRACNQAVVHADPVISASSDPDPLGPTVFHPQREPYNPGGFEWGATPEPSDFEVWTYAYDVSGLQTVTLYWRVDVDGVNPLSSTQNETYAGGAEVGAWNIEVMASSDVSPPGNILAPTYRAHRYGAMINGQTDVLIDYYVEAVDSAGNVTRSDIQHVWVGQNTPAGGGGDGGVEITPDPAQAGQNVTIEYDPAGGPLASAAQVYLHYGFDNWMPTIGPDPAMTWDGDAWAITVPVQSTASQLNVVFNDGAGTWDNNNGQDWHFTVEGASPPPDPGFVMDGQLDTGAILAASNGGMSLWVDLVGDVLYVATPDAGEGNDHFIYVAASPGAMVSANWAKAGQIAQWDAFLADEDGNDFEQWFDASGTAEAMTGTNGGVLEGTLNLAEELGSLPSEIALAVGAFQTADGGALVPAMQVPGSVNSDGNIDASEYLILDLTQFAPPPACPGDITGDGATNLADFTVLAANFGTPSGATRAQGDLTGDGAVNLADFTDLAADFGCSP
ncbi:MAG: carbohydrate-binding protein, partial [Planctomycetota bacterium]